MNEGILSVIGNTPLIELKKLYPGKRLRLLAKLEMFNPGGSIKDRPARRMIAQAMAKGVLKEGATVIESSSGNMAIGLAQACKFSGLHLIVVVDPKINDHTLKVLQTYGAEICMVNEADEHGNYLSTRLDRVQQLLDEIPGSYWPNQYANRANPGAHLSTMQEITEQSTQPPDYLFASASTCGTIMGCADYIQQHNLDTKIVAVDAVGSVIFGDSSADRLVPGHGAGRPSELLDENAVDHVVHITDEECITGCHRLLQREAILAGGSSGAVVMAVEKLQSQLPGGATCALILPDSGERYLNTIYDDEWVTRHFGTLDSAYGSKTSGKMLSSDTPFTGMKESGTFSSNRAEPLPCRIAIIGGGPKGMYGFERLAAQFNARPSSVPAEIHVYDKSGYFGAGSIYAPGQPDYLLMNNQVGDVDMWIDESPAPPVPDPKSLTKWLSEQDTTARPSDYTDRSTVGRYLSKGFEAIAANLPDNVRGQYLVAEVTDIEAIKNRYSLTITTPDGTTEQLPYRYDHILLATGHPKPRADEEHKAYRDFADSHQGVHFVPFIYPVGSMLTGIPSEQAVAIKGIGLTFVDAVLALTEGRGGTFRRNADPGTLRYEPSGDESGTIYPFSRSGLPMVPRGPVPEHPLPLQFISDSKLKELRKANGPLDFNAHILPLLQQEITFAFYHTLLQQSDYSVDLRACESFDEVKHHIDRFHNENQETGPFDADMLLRPLQDENTTAGKDFHNLIVSYLQFYIAEARKGELASPWAAATAVWRKITPLFGKHYAFGGLAADSQRYFDEQFRRLLNRVTFGPPVESMEKIHALAQAGIIDFRYARNPLLTTDQASGQFTLRSRNHDRAQPVTSLIDARIPKVSIPDNKNPLYRNIMERGLLRPFENSSGDRSYRPGCAEISREGYIIGADGTPNRQIAVTGTPTEGITFDNDALARSRNNFVSGWAARIREQISATTISRHE